MRTPVPVAGSDFSPPGLTMQNGKPFSFASSFNRSSALTFSDIGQSGLRQFFELPIVFFMFGLDLFG